MYNCIVIHYSEIATKGKNRPFFEKKLIENIKQALGKNVKKVYRRYGRIVCDLNTKASFKKIEQILKNLPGIAYFSPSIKTKLQLNEIKRLSLNALKKEKFTTFKVIAKRANKKFPKTSQELNNILGEYICKNLKKKAKMQNPDLKLFVEICEKEAFIYFKKFYSIGGLPVTTAGKIACSLSGGIDSPVSSFLMMKRGCKVVFIHIYNKTLESEAVLKKLYKIVETLTKVQLNSRLYIVPFEEIQKEIIAKVPAKYRMIIYRRFMMKLINEISKSEKAKAIVTGDSIGQVASQTLENLNCIYEASTLPVFSPLLGMNKEEIIETAKKIGTYEYSIMPYPDCCSFMVAEHPETKGEVKKIKEIEKNIKNKEKLIKASISKAKVKAFSFS